LGAQVTLANNGSEAVTKVLQQPFDLVFMDVQMPVMDGYQAAAAILAQVNNPPPIVALTANAQREEETRAMAAGMSGYLSKPVRQAELYKKITSLLGARSFTTDAAIVTPDPIESDAIAVNKSPMDPEVKSGLQQCGGDQALYCRLVAQLAELWRGMDEMLLQWPSSQDQSQAIAELQTNLHRLKGVTGNLGATRAAEQLAVIEQALKTTARIETSLEAQQFVNSHADDLEKLRHYMADYLASAMALKAPQSVEDKTERVGETEALQALKEYLIKLVSSLKENEYLESAPLQHTLQQPLDDRLKEQLTSLLNALDNFDNDCALTLAEKVLAQLD
jgi:CheY-like chemotaxis protein